MEATNRILEWRRDGVKFAKDVFNVKLDPWQVEGLRAASSTDYRPRRRVCYKAATGVGKSAVMAIEGWHRLLCYALPGEHPKGAALSGEGRDNLRDNLWAEMAKWQARSELLSRSFTWTKERIYANDHPETWFLSARSYPKTATAEEVGRSLSGLHSAFPFIMLDETGGMPAVVGQKAEQIFTGGVVDGLILQAGNPTSNDGLLYSTYENPGDTHIITITADPDDPKRSSRVDPAHAKEMIEKYGRDNPWVMATILGLFPPNAINSLLGIEDVEAAMNRHYREAEYIGSQKRLGVDCARFGSDSTFLAPRQGLVAFKPVEMKSARTPQIAARVMLAKKNWSWEMCYVDGTGGFGAGVVDALIQANQSPIEVQFSGKPLDDRYYNARAEMWFKGAEWVKRGGKLPKIPALKKQFTTPTYTFQNGKFLMEPKEQIKKRLGYSPDYADALFLTFYHPEAPAGVVLPENLSHIPQAQNFNAEWNPMESD